MKELDEAFATVRAMMMARGINAGSMREIFDAGVMAERERCARIAETCENDALPDHHWPDVIAAAIRKEPS